MIKVDYRKYVRLSTKNYERYTIKRVEVRNSDKWRRDEENRYSIYRFS